MCVLCLTKTDLPQIRFFREDVKVLCDVHPHAIDQSEGVILVTCSDGDQMPDIFKHHEKFCEHQRDEARIHLFSLNGGAKLISSDSPLRIFQEDEILLAHIDIARQMKGIDTVILYAHAPCGAAYGKDLSFADVLELLFKGKERVKREIPGIKVACFCHIDYGDKKRTYFVSYEAWKTWKESKESIQVALHA